MCDQDRNQLLYGASEEIDSINDDKNMQHSFKNQYQLFLLNIFTSAGCSALASTLTATELKILNSKVLINTLRNPDGINLRDLKSETSKNAREIISLSGKLDVKLDNLYAALELLSYEHLEDGKLPEHFPRILQLVDILSLSDLSKILTSKNEFMVSLLNNEIFANQFAQKMVQSLNTPLDAYFFYRANSFYIEYLPPSQTLILFQKLSVLISNDLNFKCGLGEFGLKSYKIEYEKNSSSAHSLSLKSALEKMFGKHFEDKIDNCMITPTEPDPISSESNSSRFPQKTISTLKTTQNIESCALNQLLPRINFELIPRQAMYPQVAVTDYYLDRKGCAISLILSPAAKVTKKSLVSIPHFLLIQISTSKGPVGSKTFSIPAGKKLQIRDIEKSVNLAEIFN